VLEYRISMFNNSITGGFNVKSYLLGELTDNSAGEFYIGMKFEDFLKVVNFTMTIRGNEGDWVVWDDQGSITLVFESNKLSLIAVENGYKGKYKGIIGIDDTIEDNWSRFAFIETKDDGSSDGFLIKGNNTVLFIVKGLSDIIPAEFRQGKLFDLLHYKWYQGYKDIRVRGQVMSKVPIKRIEICAPEYGFNEFGPVSL